MADSLSRSGMAGNYSDETFLFDCDLCRYDDIVSEGVGFCQSCQEYLCATCMRVHKRSKATKSHVILQGDDLHKAKKSSVQYLGFESCSLHKEKTVVFYCTDHDEVFCQECRNLHHRRCGDVQDISTACVGIVTSQSVASLVNSTDLLVKKLESVRDERNSDLNTLMAKREPCLEDINTFRSKINDTLDRLENAVFQKLEETVKTEKKLVTEHVTSLESAIKSIETDMKNLEAAKQQGHDGKVFVAMKKFSTEVTTKILNDINEEKHQVDMRFIEDSVLSDVLANLKMLGELQVDKNKPETSGKKSASGDNCIPAGNKNKKISKRCEENVKEPGDKLTCGITGMVFLPNGKLLMTDYKNDKLKLADVNIKLESSISIQAPWDVALVGPGEAVVTTTSPQKLQFVTLEPSLQLGRTVDVKWWCYGVAVCGERILVSCHDYPGKGEVLVMDRQGVVQRRLGARSDGSYMFTGPFNFYIAVNSTGDKLYVSDADDHSPTVTCLRLADGATLYTYSDREVKEPRSLLVDEDDSVYVCDWDLRHVQVITKDGQKYRTLLTRADGLKEKPRALAYRKRDDTLVVGSSESDVLQIYKFQ